MAPEVKIISLGSAPISFATSYNKMNRCKILGKARAEYDMTLSAWREYSPRELFQQLSHSPIHTGEFENEGYRTNQSCMGAWRLGLEDP